MGYSDFTFGFSTKSTGNLDEDVLTEIFPSPSYSQEQDTVWFLAYSTLRL